jgi:hypothetical protein
MERTFLSFCSFDRMRTWSQPGKCHGWAGLFNLFKVLAMPRSLPSPRNLAVCCREIAHRYSTRNANVTVPNWSPKTPCPRNETYSYSNCRLLDYPNFFDHQPYSLSKKWIPQLFMLVVVIGLSWNNFMNGWGFSFLRVSASCSYLMHCRGQTYTFTFACLDKIIVFAWVRCKVYCSIKFPTVFQTRFVMLVWGWILILSCALWSMILCVGTGRPDRAEVALDSILYVRW